MSRKSFIVSGLAVMAALLISACGTPTQYHQEKIAVVNYENVVKEHPEQSRLARGEALLAELKHRRKLQERMALEQLQSLERLRALTAASQQSYLEADFNTRMVEMQTIENERLQKLAAQAAVEADKKIADRKAAVEESYRLEIFNLRIQLESVKLKPELREQIHLKLVKAKEAREQELSVLEEEKNSLIQAAMEPHIEAARKKLAVYAAQQQSDINNKLMSSEANQQEKLQGAPDALRKALAIMDKEIEKQQAANDELANRISKDIISISTKLAHERGYSIVFKEVKVNLEAADITEDVVSQLKKVEK